MLYYIFSLCNNNFMHVANKSCAVKRCIFIAPAWLLFSDVWLRTTCVAAGWWCMLALSQAQTTSKYDDDNWMMMIMIVMQWCIVYTSRCEAKYSPQSVLCIISRRRKCLRCVFECVVLADSLWNGIIILFVNYMM